MQKLLTFLIAVFMVFSGANAAEIGDGQKNAQIVTTEYVQSYLRNAADTPELELAGVAPDALASEEYVLSAIDFVNGDGNLRKYARPNTLVGISYLPNIADKINTCPVPWDTTPNMMSYVDTGMIWDDYEIPVGIQKWSLVAYGDGVFVAMSYGVWRSYFGAVIRSADGGKTWTEINLPVAAHWSGLVFGDGVFVASGTDGQGNSFIIYSTDGGINWEASSLLFTGSIAYGNGAFVGIGGGYAVHSVDGGKTWVETTYPGNSYYDSISYVGGMFITKTHYSTDNGKTWDSLTDIMPMDAEWTFADGGGALVAVAYSSNVAVYSTDGGDTWNTTTMPSSAYWNSITYGDGVFVASALSPVSIAYSTDGGQTWHASTLADGVSYQYVRMTYGNGVFFATYGYKSFYSPAMQGYAYYSTDGGKTWKDVILPLEAIWAPPHFGGGVFVVTAASLSGVAIYSANGIDWNVGDILTEEGELPLNSLVYSDGMFVGVTGKYNVEDYSLLSNTVVYSKDGKTWGKTFLPGAGNWVVIYGDGVFVAFSKYRNTPVGWYRSSNVYYSTDGGETWTQATVLPSLGFWEVVGYGGGTFVAMQTEYSSSDDKVVTYSTDGGKTWADTPLDGGWYDVAYGDGKFIAIGYDDGNYVMAYSNDAGKNWEKKTQAIQKRFYKIEYGDGVFFAIGSGYAMRSTDGGETWNEYEMPFDASSLMYGDGKFIAANSSEWGYSVDGGQTWISESFPYQAWRRALSYADDKLMFWAERTILVGAVGALSNTNPWAVGDGCTVVDGAISCDAPLVGGVATCKKAVCSCLRQKLIKNGEYIDNIATVPVEINRTFADQNACNMQCADVCADNAVNNTDGAQKAILCGK